MEEREKSSGSFFCEYERWGALLRGLLSLVNLYPSGPNGTLSAALPHQGAALIKTTLLDVKFCWLFWLSMRMWFSGFEHLVQQLDSCSWIPLNSTAFFKLNIQNIK
jgi:hypothetical protein